MHDETHRGATDDPSADGIPVGVLISPLIPGLTDADIERIVVQQR